MKRIYTVIFCFTLLFIQSNLLANCYDGILNGDETDVDCGGSCADCDEPRAVFRFLLYSSFYTGENTFELKTNNPGEPSEVINTNPFVDINFDAAKNDTFCVYYNLPVGCYTFTIYDSAADGLQNFFEQGFYDLGLDGNIIKQGGEFGFVEVTDFCVTFETCDDGIQNGEEEGIDCGGPDCDPCIIISCEDGIQNGDEEGIDCGGANCEPCATCEDGIKNGDEEDIDCGGANCEPCITCVDGIQNGDEEGIDCGGSFCEPCITCVDGIQNGDEEGIDCGGSFCEPCITCVDGIQNGDEEGIDCGGSFCEPCITCVDGIQNGDEEGIDCGGSFCEPCITCVDGIQNGDEEGIDCGGSFCEPCITCIDGIQNGDEEGIDCGGSFCEPCITCVDGIQNGDETGIDCGGSYCPPCFTCFDGIQNGNEEGIDCGGSFCEPCITCVDGIKNGDEEGIDCGGSFCEPCITCIDGIQNGDEEGIDCGGSFCEPCITCVDGIQNGDEEGIDCGGSFCEPCITCIDGIQNGDEEGIDCGGSFCEPCITCIDGIQNGDEEGIDCGGSFCEPCITCVDGIQNGDEEGVDCGGSFCEPCITCIDGIQNGDEEGIDCGGSFCETCITCVDGIQNGDEEGIDCGGSFCEPCHPCRGDTLVLTEPIQVCDSVNLIAGQNHIAGSVTIQRDGDNLIITYTTSGNWTISETHLSVVNCTTTSIPTTGANNPKIGQFEFSETHSDVQEVVYTVNITEQGIDDLYCMAAHAVVSNGTNEETAWAEGLDFGGNSWAMYLENNLSECESEICIACTDGIQNWDEEGIDCGGAYCLPCATCEDGIQNGDETGVDCGGEFCEPCTPCSINVEYTISSCNDKGTSDPQDDKFMVDIIVSGNNTSDKWSGTLGGQTLYGDYDTQVTFGPFLINAGSSISGWFMDKVDSNCQMDIIVQAPSACSTCDDGILNGDEEEVDCGGAYCEPCVPENSLVCSSNNTKIDVYVGGLEDNSECLSIPNIEGVLSLTAEVWICEGACNSLPKTIKINGVRTPFAFQTSGNVSERLYRIELENVDSEVCIKGIPNCTMSSLVVFAERASNTTISAVAGINREIYEGELPSGDDCETITFPTGNSDIDRDITVTVPIHEKDNKRTVRVTASAGQVSESITTKDNIDHEVGLIELLLPNVPANVDLLHVEICSPDNKGDSFGVGLISFSAECVESTENFNGVHEEVTERINMENQIEYSSSFKNEMSLYPNPTRDILNIDFELNEDLPVQVIISDINGRKISTEVKDGTSGSNTMSLNVSNLSAGFYLVNLQAGDENQVQKIVVFD